MGRNTWSPGDGQQAALEVLDGTSELESDVVPTMDQEHPVASHRDWLRSETRVVTCRIANDLYKDERFETRAEAAAAITKRHGRILEANYVPGRAFFRVRRDVKSV